MEKMLGVGRASD